LKRPSPVLMLMVVLAVLSVGLWAQSVGLKLVSSEPAEEIRALENAINEAMFRGDVSALDKMTSDDYTVITTGGRLNTKRETLEWLSRKKFRDEYKQVYDLSIRVYGDAAVVTGRCVQTAQEGGKDYTDAYRFTRLYIRQKGHWLSVAWQMTRTEGQQ
jgi:ketosteroid isomerase-like protein